MQYIFKKENVNPKLMDSLVYWMVGATIVGARLGHVFFYDWGYYKNHIGEILMVWKGGLASHGAAISIVLAMARTTRIAKRAYALDHGPYCHRSRTGRRFYSHGELVQQ